MLLLSFSCPPPPPHPPPKKTQTKQPPQFFTRRRSDECAIQRRNVPRLSSPNEVRAGCICHSGRRRDVTRVVESFHQHSSRGRGSAPSAPPSPNTAERCAISFPFHLSAWSSEAGRFFFSIYLLIPPCCCNGCNYLPRHWRRFDTQWSSSSHLACSGHMKGKRRRGGGEGVGNKWH